MKRLLSIVLVGMIAVSTACSNEQKTTEKETPKPKTEEKAQTTSTTIPEKVKKPLKIALIMEFSIGTFSTQYIKGVKEQVEKFGGEVQVYNSENDLAKMAANLDTAVNAKVDGILIDHGRMETLQKGVEKAIQQGIPVVAFDNDLRIPGVTIVDQDDYSLAWESLKTMAEDLNGKGNVAVIWVGGFTPMERRNVMIDAFYKRYPDIKEVARFGGATKNTMLDTQAQVDALLKKYPNKGDLNAIFASWDEFAKGATKALQQAGRTDIKVYGIDLSDEDLQLIQQPNSPWVATSATDPSDVGRVQVRFLYQKVAGEKTPDVFSLTPHLVSKNSLPNEAISFDALDKYVTDWKKSTAASSPWMEQLGKEKK